MFCMKCGTDLPDDAEFCMKCGTKRADAQSGDKQRQNENNISEKIQEKDIASINNDVSAEDLSEFRHYLDEQIKTKTKYKSAQELLECKPMASKLTWIIVFIGIGMFLIGLLYPVFILPSLIFVTAGEIGLVFYKMVKVDNCPFNYNGTFDDPINGDDLKSFMNQHLTHLQPYFNEWDHEDKSKSSLVTSVLVAGVAGAVTHMAEKSQEQYAAQAIIRLQTSFSKKKYPYIVIDIRPNSENNELNTFKYAIHITKLNRDNYGKGYKCMCKTAPIVQAAMEYYLKNRHQ